MNEEGRLGALEVRADGIEKRLTKLEDLTSNYKGEVERLNNLDKDIQEIKSNVQKLIDIKDREMKERLDQHNDLIKKIVEEIIVFILGLLLSYIFVTNK